VIIPSTVGAMSAGIRRMVHSIKWIILMLIYANFSEADATKQCCVVNTIARNRGILPKELLVSYACKKRNTITNKGHKKWKYFENPSRN